MKCSVCGFNSSRKQRSNNQNRYYFGILVHFISEHTGYSVDETHEILKHKFLCKTVWVQHNVAGVKEMNVIARSTAELTTAEFEKYLSEIRSWASLCLGLNLPEPNEI